MLSKNTFRLAYASATPIENRAYEDIKNRNISFDSSQRGDFEAFSSSPSSRQARAPRPQKPPRRTPNRVPVTLEIPGRSLLIGAGVIVGIILLIVLCVSILTGGVSNVEYEDNAFACYVDTDGSYRVAMNGKTLDQKFSNEVTLTEAADCSFAYVSTEVDEAVNVYILDAGKLTLLCEKIDKPLAFCGYVPGVVYKYGDRIEYSFDGVETTLSKKNDALPENFVISPDGKAVAFTIKNDSSISDLYLYTEEMASPTALSNGAKNTIPVSVSNGGEYIVAYTEDASAKDLYLFVGTEDYKINEIVGSFDSLIAQNADATEIVFATKRDSDYSTYVYDCTELKKDVTVAHYVSNGYAVPDYIDEKIAAPATFKKTYFTNVTTPMTVYINKKYEHHDIYNYVGQIDPEGKYLYVIVSHLDNTLAQIELLGESNGKETNSKSVIGTDVTDFIVTEKGNIYYIDGYGDLYFYKLSKGKPTRITNDVTALVFYTYANELYFERVDSVEENGIYHTSEGSDHEQLKFGKTELRHTPTVASRYSKKSYAYYYDKDEDKYFLFYTSNGRSFKQVNDCNELVSVHENPIDSLVKDILK